MLRNLSTASLLIVFALSGTVISFDTHATDAHAKHRPPPSSSPLSIDASGPVDPHLQHLSFDTTKFELIRQLPAGSQLRFDDFLDLNIDLELSVQRVFTPNAVVVTVAPDGTHHNEAQSPDVVHLSGTTQGDATSLVLISLSPAGSTGFIRTAALSLSIEAAPEAGRHSVLIEASDLELGNPNPVDPFTPPIYASHDALEPPEHIIIPLVENSAKPVLSLALECDQKCKAKLEASAGGSSAVEYIGTLIAGINTIVQRDVGRGVQISHLRIWDTASPFDGGTGSLNAFKDYYEQNMQGVQYDLGHYFTGENQGGVAWVGTVCTAPYNVAVSAIGGGWQGSHTQSGSNWDLLVTAHEMGHNLGSPHTHDYSPPIDECYNPSTGLVDSCQVGTLMGYCHLCPSGVANVNMHYHPRAIEVIKSVTEQRCGPAGDDQPTEAPSTAPPGDAPTDAPTEEAGSCLTDGTWFLPLDMAGQGRTVATPQACQQRCQSTTGCKYFNNFPNGGCHITTGEKGAQEGGSNPTVTSGSKDCAEGSTDAPTDEPTVGPTDAPTDAPTVGGCTDQTLADGSPWHDIEGSQYTCAWYAERDHCEHYGSSDANGGFTAKQACCVCQTAAPTSAPTDEPTAAPTGAPTAAPTGAPTAAPTSAPTGEPTAAPTDPPTVAPTDTPCTDQTLSNGSPWHDIEGSQYTCAWYAERDHCEHYGSSDANGGFTAKQTCCVCQPR